MFLDRKSDGIWAVCYNFYFKSELLTEAIAVFQQRTSPSYTTNRCLHPPTKALTCSGSCPNLPVRWSLKHSSSMPCFETPVHRCRSSLFLILAHSAIDSLDVCAPETFEWQVRGRRCGLMRVTDVKRFGKPRTAISVGHFNFIYSKTR